VVYRPDHFAAEFWDIRVGDIVKLSGMLIRPEYHEAKAEARKCEAEAKKILRGRGQHLWGRGHEASHYNASTFYNEKFMFFAR